MKSALLIYAVGALVAGFLLHQLQARLRLSRAKHPSLSGHARLARRIAALVPFYGYGEAEFFKSDGAPDDVVAQRRAGFKRLESALAEASPVTIAASEALEGHISDAAFTSHYRIPFQFRDYVRKHLKVGSIMTESAARKLKDLDGQWAYDLAGSYGVNVFGYDFYKECIDAGIARVRNLGPVLGHYHPLIDENVERLREISGLDEVSFHMSGTEAVMQAVRLARYHTRKSHVVVFSGAYHGWWDGVQPGIGNSRRVDDVYVLRDMSGASLEVLRTRNDIACVLVNPLQALHPNKNAQGDATLVDSSRAAAFDRDAYRAWLEKLREVCTQRSIVLIFDEVFVGFRLARSGAQEYFGVRADMVTYGKTLGGGLPVGVVCGKSRFMKRFRDDRPSDVCFARGTFNSHPYVMAAMSEFLRRIDEPEIRASYATVDAVWNARTRNLNERLEERGLPVRVANLASVWTIVYLRPSRYNWMFQYYLRAAGLVLSWVGTGRLILSHDFSDSDFAAVTDRFVRAAEEMNADGWWWASGHLTNRWIRRRILREMLARRFGRPRVEPLGAPQTAQPAVLSSGSVSPSRSGS